MRALMAAAVLLGICSMSSQAQTDFGSPVGAGGGLGASVAPLGVGGSAARSGYLAFATRFGNARSTFLNATGAGVQVPSPAGGTVAVPTPAAQALGAVLSWSATAAQLQTLNAALGGGVVNGALVSALQALVAEPSGKSLVAAREAYNAAIRATPAGQTPSATIIAVRGLLAGTL